jgi:YggT family protein
MKYPLFIVAFIAFCFCSVDASVFLPKDMSNKLSSRRSIGMHLNSKQDLSSRTKRFNRQSSTAMAIPGYGVAEQVFVGGFANFLNIYNFIITARILLSWFPQAQSVGILQPVYQITDPFLNIFRGVIPSIGGLDFSPIAAFFLLNLLSNATAALGAEIPADLQKKLNASRRRGHPKLSLYKEM